MIDALDPISILDPVAITPSIATISNSIYQHVPLRRSRHPGYAAIDQICDYYKTLNERPVRADVKPGYLIEQLPSECLKPICLPRRGHHLWLLLYIPLAVSSLILESIMHSLSTLWLTFHLHLIRLNHLPLKLHTAPTSAFGFCRNHPT